MNTLHWNFLDTRIDLKNGSIYFKFDLTKDTHMNNVLITEWYQIIESTKSISDL